MTLAGTTRATLLSKPLAARSRFYERGLNRSEIMRLQLDLFNELWSEYVRTIPHWKDVVRSGKLPDRFSSWEEFAGVVPISTRSIIRDNVKRMSDERGRPELYRITGGSTAEPLQLPARKDELGHAGVDMWLARSWFGVTPASRLFLIWGHSHLLGTGFHGWVAKQSRIIKDALLGTERISAYDLSEASLRAAGQRLIERRPEYLVGYSVALDLFARANQDRAQDFRNLGLKCVIGAAEAFPHSDSIGRLNQLFGCPVTMEYGSVETNLVAHQLPAGGFRVFYGSYFVEAERVAPGSRVFRIRVTSLYPRYFPLLRYELGDEIELGDDVPDRVVLGITNFRRVLGRCNDYVVLPDGSRIHSELFTHVVRSRSQIRCYQVAWNKDRVRLDYEADSRLSKEDQAAIRGALSRVHPALSSIELNKVASLQRTIAGKTRMVVPLEELQADLAPGGLDLVRASGLSTTADCASTT